MCVCVCICVCVCDSNLIASNSQMLDFLSKEEHKTRPILLHGFSIGGYLYTNTVSLVLEGPEKYG